jgi:hypothetical protein
MGRGGFERRAAVLVELNLLIEDRMFNRLLDRTFPLAEAARRRPLPRLWHD